MLSKNKIKLLRQLELKKYRDAEGLFFAEGKKIVRELLGQFECVLLCATNEFLQTYPNLIAKEIISVSIKELQQISQLNTPRDVIAVFRKPTPVPVDLLSLIPQHKLVLALDGVQNPGNVGTIIRVADWFGIEHLFCSSDTADAFAPKTIQATMGAIGRVQVHYLDLATWLQTLPSSVRLMGTFLDGEDIYTSALPKSGVLVMGNEGQGISYEVEQMVHQRLYIPSFPAHRPTSESLNVAIATAILCGELRRRMKS